MLLSVSLCVCGAAALFVDHWIGSHLAVPPHEIWPFKGDLKKLIALSEVFGHGTGVILVTVAMIAIDHVHRWRFGILLGTAFGAGLAANIVKFVGVARYRPYAFDFSQSIWDSFYQPFPALAWSIQEELRSSAMQSFPSAHAATAAGLCVGLCFLYPHARWFFLGMTALACWQRVIFQMHFPSDVCFGAALGFLVGTLLISAGRLPELVLYCDRVG